MKKTKTLKIIYGYISDENPEKRRGAERTVRHAYDFIFGLALKRLRSIEK